MNTGITGDTAEPAKRSTLNLLSMFCFALTTAFLTASVFLIYQYKMGIPFNFVTSVLLAAAAALVLPILAGIVTRKLQPNFTYPGMTGFSLANLVIAVGTGLFIF